MRLLRYFSKGCLNSLESRSARAGAIPLVLLLTAVSSGCGPTDSRGATGLDSIEVRVNQRALGFTVGPSAFGMHGSVYDNALHDPAAPALVRDAGVSLIRWPGGGYSDNYHWATHTMTPFANGDRGYLAKGTDFGGFVRALESFGAQAMITVNYGSNQQSNGPGEPLEAAAWVAYANGEPSSEQVLGVDSTGFDWQTVGYWASLRASEPLAVDDGKNFLRIAHAEPLAIRYWEIGNELFGNGYYSGEYELDLHAPYGATKRLGHPDLSPSTYGRGVVSYAEQMKAVDPSISIGAVLNTPPMDYSWGPDWNDGVLREAGNIADFLIVHWYPGGSLHALLDAPRAQVPAMMVELEKSMAKCCPGRQSAPEITVTEMGPNAGVAASGAQSQITGLFAVDGYATLLEHGVANIDWLELHNGTFLSERSQRLGPAYKGIQLASRFVRPGDTFVESSMSVNYALRAHAAVRSDGSVSVLLVNVASESVATVNLSFADAWAPARAERYDYRPEGATGDGQVVGPVEVSAADAQRVEIGPYSALVLVLYPN